MAVQTQKEEKRINPFEQEEDTVSSSQRNKQKRKAEKRKGIPLALGIFLCLLALIGGRYLRSNTTLFLENRTVKGFLPVEEYVFKNKDSGTPVQNPRTFHYDSYYVYNTHRQLYETSRGIAPGASWDEFVAAYGDATASSVYTNRYDENGEIDWDYRSVGVSEQITVKEFDEQYVKTGTVDLSRDSITISFNLDTDGMKLYYSLDEAWDEYQHNRFRHLFSSSPNTKSFNLSFCFEPDINGEHNGTNTLDCMYSTYY